MSSGANWFPEPRRKDKPPPTAAKLLLGTLLPVLAIAGLVVALTGFRHPSHVAAGKTTTVQATSTRVDPREAFSECMRSAGVGRGGGRSAFGGRFGGRPNLNKFREAYAICRSVIQSAGAPSGPTTQTTPAAPPVA